MRLIKSALLLFLIAGFIKVPAQAILQEIELSNFLYKHKIYLNSNDNKALYEEACFWDGTPYKSYGNDDKGFDCSGFTKKVYAKVFGNVSLKGSSRDIAEKALLLEKDELKEGDLVFFKMGGHKSNISHVGIYLKDGKFIHSSTSKGIAINSLDEEYYKKTFFCGGRIIEKNVD